MPTINPYIGGTAAAILLSDRSTRIYYQTANSAIHEASGTGPAVQNPNYHDRVIVSEGIARFNTPIAAATWNGENGEQVSVPNYICSFEDILTVQLC
jgi:hypothetical protein